MSSINDPMIALMRGVNARVFDAFGDRVISGPFAGMRVPQESPWEDGNAGAKLIGSYEHELHRVIEIALRRDPRTIINVGCAEGYYAIGMAMLAPKAKVIAFDIDPRSLATCMAGAQRNGVADRISARKGCRKPSELAAGEPRRLYLMDCEGAELGLLDPALCPILTRSDIIVECHDFFREDISCIIANRFECTHIVGVVEPRPPRLKDFPFLAFLPLGTMLMAVTDKRPAETTWLVMWAKT